MSLVLTGARKHLEKGHTQHMRTTVARHKLAAERGADPDPLREVQAYIQVGGAVSDRVGRVVVPG
jgi:hypothetical protein